jgi:hypothetical protein
MKRFLNRIKLMLGISPYFKLKDGGVFACDCDDTLVMWAIPEGYVGPLVETNLEGFKDKGIPNLHAIAHLKKMKSRGYAIIVWSAGGSEWAEAVVKALDLQSFVDITMPKIDFHLDDVPDPVDKIGKWQYIDLKGTVYSKDKEGVVHSKKHGIIQ